MEIPCSWGAPPPLLKISSLIPTVVSARSFGHCELSSDPGHPLAQRPHAPGFGLKSTQQQGGGILRPHVGATLDVEADSPPNQAE